MGSKVDIRGLKEVIKKVDRLAERVRRDDGKKMDLAKERIFVPGNFLHQDTREMSEEASAAFERENKEFFAFLWALDEEFGDIF